MDSYSVFACMEMKQGLHSSVCIESTITLSLILMRVFSFHLENVLKRTGSVCVRVTRQSRTTGSTCVCGREVGKH